MTRPSLPRPTLLPGLRPLWRDRHTVQLGTDPAQAVVLEFPHPAAAHLLDLLDGSRTERAIIGEMSRIGMSSDDVQSVLTALVEAGLVVAAHSLMPSALPADQRHRVAAEAAAIALRFRERPTSPAAILRRRYSARVIIAGDGAFAKLLTPALLDAGVGTVGKVNEPGSPARDASGDTWGDAEHGVRSNAAPRGRRIDAASEAALRDDPAAAPASRNNATSGAAARAESARQPGRIVRADDAFVIQIGRMSRIPLRGARSRLPHLALNVRDGVAIVGPLVPATGGPCLRCLDLHRTDRDPAWPRLAAQLAENAKLAEKKSEPVPCAAATMLTAAGLAAAEVLAYLDGAEPSTIGSTVEINGVAPWRRRTWTPHAACDCTRRGR